MRILPTRVIALLSLFAFPLAQSSAVEDCPCDPAVPATLAIHQCSLCREAELRPKSPEVFFLKDNSPLKPNRWLALPRRHSPGVHVLEQMSHAERTVLWEAAIAKAKSMWENDWGLAINGAQVRSQCHLHIHIGKLLRSAETGERIVFSHASEIPLRPGEGIWVHPISGGKFHAHLGEQSTESVLLR